MPHSIRFRPRSVIGAGVEPASPPVGGEGSTHPPMPGRAASPTVGGVQFRDQPPPSTEGPPRALRALGLLSMAAVLISTVTVDPKPGWTGDGPLVMVAIAGMATGLVLA